MKKLLILLILCVQQGLHAENTDTGKTLKEASKLAPAQTNEFSYALGKWKVKQSNFDKDGKIATRKGYSRISFVNRGHGYIERANLVDSNKVEENFISFYAFGKFNKKWMMGRVSENKESVEMFDGHMKDNVLVFRTAVRNLGGANVTMSKVSYAITSTTQFSVTTENSTDYGQSWKKTSESIYSKANKDEVLTFDENPKKDDSRSSEQKQFDFLVGNGKAVQNIQVPTGQWVKFASNTSADFALNGKAVYEYNWYNVDKNNPESATSIIRIYNRNMQRWETLFYSNRANSLFFFGGNKEQNKIVLHNFETNSENKFNRWVFYNIKKSRYSWFAESSLDSGKTFKKTWEIEVQL